MYRYIYTLCIYIYMYIYIRCVCVHMYVYIYIPEAESATRTPYNMPSMVVSTHRSLAYVSAPMPPKEASRMRCGSMSTTHRRILTIARRSAKMTCPPSQQSACGYLQVKHEQSTSKARVKFPACPPRQQSACGVH